MSRRSRSSTAITSFPAGVAIACLGAFSVGVSYFGWSPLLTLGLLPIPVLLCYGIVRAARGMPATIAGVTEDGSSSGSTRPRYQLVAMPVNHFGEKLRWCLDLLDVDYEESNVGGILSILLRGRTVPWLVDRRSCSLIGNSDEALWYLSAVHVPTLEGAARDRGAALLSRTEGTRAWEARLNALGHAIQGWAYYYLLDAKADPELSLRFWGGREPRVPALQRLALRLGHPVLRVAMRRAFRLDDRAAHERRYATILEALDAADAALERSGGRYLTGDSISYVDVGFCALLGPLLPQSVLPHWAGGRFSSFAPLQSHPSTPAELREFEEAFVKRPCGQFVARTFLTRARPASDAAA